MTKQITKTIYLCTDSFGNQQVSTISMEDYGWTMLSEKEVTFDVVEISPVDKSIAELVAKKATLNMDNALKIEEINKKISALKNSKEVLDDAL